MSENYFRQTKIKREFISSRPTLQEMLQEVPEAGKTYRTETWIYAHKIFFFLFLIALKLLKAKLAAMCYVFIACLQVKKMTSI